MADNSGGSEGEGEDSAPGVASPPADRGDEGRVRDDPYAVLRDGNFLRYVAAGMVSTIGAQMQGVAVGWELYERTGSALALGMLGLVQVIPVILLAIPAGQAVDRYDRKGMVLLAQSLLLATSSALAVLSWSRGPVALTYGLLVLTGVGQSLNRPARWSIQPQVVPREQLLSAVTWNTSIWQIAAMVGPALGGLVVAVTGGAMACYLLNAGCAAAVIVLTASLRLRAVQRDSRPVTLDSLLAGLRFVLGSELILATMTLDLVAVFLGGSVALLPIFAKDLLQIGPTGLGWLRAAPSMGSFLMAMFLAHRPPMRRSGRSLLWAVAGFGVATIVFGLSTSPWLSFTMLLLTGAMDNVSVVVRQTLIQMLTPDEMRGRVSAVNAIFIGSSNELGEFESGVAARLIGPTAAVVLGGIGTVATALAVTRIWPGVLRLGSLRELRPHHRPQPDEEAVTT